MSQKVRVGGLLNIVQPVIFDTSKGVEVNTHLTYKGIISISYVSNNEIAFIDQMIISIDNDKSIKIVTGNWYSIDIRLSDTKELIITQNTWNNIQIAVRLVI